MKCRHCKKDLESVFLDLGSSPPSNSYLRSEQLNKPEIWFPLKLSICDACWLVQTHDFHDSGSLFDDNYAYFSGFSSTWLEHCKVFVGEVVQQLELDERCFVIEVASNDGYLLQYFQEYKIPVLGIEPTASTAAVARSKQIEVVEEFFGQDLANKISKTNGYADLMIANNVLAHVPDINDFVIGFYDLLKPNGVASFEFPHLLNLLNYGQFDTVYHEHYSYLSLTAVKNIFSAAGLEVFDVKKLPTHGGSLRIYAQKKGLGVRPVTKRVKTLIEEEKTAGLASFKKYISFQERVKKIKNDFLSFLLRANEDGAVVVAYGAAAKGNTLLNYAGVRADLIKFVVDLNPKKQGKFLPGSHIPIVNEDQIKKEKPDYIVILPWNLTTEITDRLSYVREWECKFVTAIPEMSIFRAS